jgi:hypothetical protein
MDVRVALLGQRVLHCGQEWSMLLMKKAFRFGVVTGGHPSRSAWITLARR